MNGEGMPPELRECIRNSALMFWYHPDVTRPALWCPDGFLLPLGYAPGEVSATVDEYLARVHPDDLPRMRQRIANLPLAREDIAYEADYRMRRADGLYVWVRTTVSARHRPETPGTVSAFAFSRAIPEEQRLERSRPGPQADALHTVLNEIGQPVVLMSPAGVVVEANEAAVRAMGSRWDGIVGRCCPFLHSPEVPLTAMATFRSAIATATRQRLELERFGVWWHVHLVPIPSASGVVEQVLLVAADVTELKARERERLESERSLMQTLVREVHHRIKNHLQGLVGLLRMHQREGVSTDEVIERAILQVHSIATVHGLLARHSSDGVDLNVIVRETVRLVEQDRPGALRFEVELDDTVTADLEPDDAVAMALVIGELVMNAAKHTARTTDAFVQITLRGRDASTTELLVRNGPARLPAGFSLRGAQGSRGGLDLVQRLLPTDSEVELTDEDGSVVARLSLPRGGHRP